MEIMPAIKRSLTDNIKEDLRRYILDLDISSSAKLPSETYMAEQFDVSRVTIRRVLDDLEQENVVIRIHGKGTFVNPEALQIKVPLTPSQEFWNLIIKSGYTPRVEIIDLVKDVAFPGIAKELGMPEDTPMVCVEKIYFADDHAAIICINYIPMNIFTTQPSIEEWRTQSAFHLLREKAGCIVLRDKIEIQTKSMAQLCKLTGQAERLNCESVLEMDVVNYDKDNKPVMYGLIFKNTNYIRYNQIRNLDVF